MHAVEVLRRFNRSHARRIGVLDDSFLGTGRPLGESRVLFEIGLRGVSVYELRRRLDLDSGYLSRMLRRLEHAGLVEITVDPEDRRRRIVKLTTVGRTEWRILDERSNDAAQQLLAPLPGRRRDELAAVLARADRLLRAATLTFDAVDPRAPAARWSMQQYFAELDRRFPAGFDPGDALDAGADAMRPPAGAFLVAADDGEPVACGGVQPIDAVTAEIKRMWVHPDWRSAGLGRRMLEHLERVVGERGYARVVLDTDDTLTEAIALYERAGYVAIVRYNDNPYARRWFEKLLSR